MFCKKLNDETIRQFKDNINVKENNCIPIFCKVYNVLYAFRNNVENELFSHDSKSISLVLKSVLINGHRLL